jgi:hypothetical protein
MKLAGVQSEWAEVIRGLDNLHQVEANFPDRSLQAPYRLPCQIFHFARFK